MEKGARRPWSGLVVYSLISDNEVIYVGHGVPTRPFEWSRPSMYRRLYLKVPPTIFIHFHDLTRKEAEIKEAELISELNPKYNKARFKTAGGLIPWNKGKYGDPRHRPPSWWRGKRLSAEHRAAISRGNKGNPKCASNKGRSFTDEHKARISIALRGDPRLSHAKGKKFTGEHKARISAALKGKPKSSDHRAAMTGRVRSPEHCAALSKALKGKTPWNKKEISI